VADAREDQVTLSYEHDDGRVRRGEPVDADLVDGTQVTVLMDRVNAELTVRAGDRDVLVAWLVDLAGSPRPTPRPAATPLCNDLAARLAD
jgi:hypothetical protein